MRTEGTACSTCAVLGEGGRAQYKTESEKRTDEIDVTMVILVSVCGECRDRVTCKSIDGLQCRCNGSRV